MSALCRSTGSRSCRDTSVASTAPIEEVPLPEMDSVGFERTLRGLLGRASVSAEAELGASFDARVLDSIDLAHHREGLVGLENLCVNLYEFAVSLTEHEERSLLGFADAWGLDERARALIVRQAER